MQAEIFEMKRIMQAVDMRAGYYICGQEEAKPLLASQVRCDFT